MAAWSPWPSPDRPAAAGRPQAKLLGNLHDLAEPLPDLRLGQRTEETVSDLAGHDRHDHRDALHLQGGAQLRIGVDVDLGEHERAVGFGGELLQDRPELLAGPAPLGPQVENDGHGARAGDDLSVERLVGDVEDESGLGARLAASGRALLRGTLPALHSGLAGAQVDGAMEGKVPRLLHDSILPHDREHLCR